MHTTGSAPKQTPPEQTSIRVQTLPSSQGVTLGAWVQPVIASHESSVQGLLSSQSIASVPAVHATPGLDERFARTLKTVPSEFSLNTVPPPLSPPSRAVP